MVKLGVNIDHVATLRQQRREAEPDVAEAALAAIRGGADGITVHLREDRRHIQDFDVWAVREIAPRLNFEMAVTDEMVAFACRVKPDFCCLVPERREELTTEGGLNVPLMRETLLDAVKTLQNAGIQVSLFVDPEISHLDMAHQLGADFVELHTGQYAMAPESELCIKQLKAAASYGAMLGLGINAGHGLKYGNVAPIARLPHLVELNIGHSIVSRAVFVGLETAVSEMKDRINGALSSRI
ncbi:pyridoxine 5'-phosphate synthase [bacterium]|nr:pyridoxine 5'-phosphate synthase [bacterium]